MNKITNPEFLLLLAFVYSLFIEPEHTSAQSQFQLAIGGPGSDFANSIIKTIDGGYIVAGTTGSFGAGQSDMYIVKLDLNGTLVWSKTIGGTLDDVATSIIQTTDGGYAVAGYTRSFGGGEEDFYIVKLNSNGTLQWGKTVGGTASDRASSIIQTADGGYAAGGTTSSFGAGQSDMYIVKLDPNGVLQWTRTIGGTNSDGGNPIMPIIQTIDSGYAVAGTTNSFGAGLYDIYIVKLDASGSLLWSRTIGGTSYDGAHSIIQITNGGYAVAGVTYSFGVTTTSIYIVTLDASGLLQWSKTIVGSNNGAYSIIQTTDGGYAVAGGSGLHHMYIAKLDASGTLQWNKSVGEMYTEEAYSMVQTTDGGYLEAGYTNSFGSGLFDMYIVKLDASGNTCGNITTPSPTTGSGGIFGNPASTVTSPTPTVTTPTSSTSTGGTLTTICTLVGTQPASNEIPVSYKLYQNYPNPFNPVTTIKYDIPKDGNVSIKIYDITGREVYNLNEYKRAGSYSEQFDGTNIASGIYLYRIESGTYVDTKKMVLLK